MTSKKKKNLYFSTAHPLEKCWWTVAIQIEVQTPNSTLTNTYKAMTVSLTSMWTNPTFHLLTCLSLASTREATTWIARAPHPLCRPQGKNSKPSIREHYANDSKISGVCTTRNVTLPSHSCSLFCTSVLGWLTRLIIRTQNHRLSQKWESRKKKQVNSSYWD